MRAPHLDEDVHYGCNQNVKNQIPNKRKRIGTYYPTELLMNANISSLGCPHCTIVPSNRFADEPQEVTFQPAKGYLLAPKRRQIATQKATYYERID